MKSNLIITWKHSTLDIEGKEVYHNGSWKGGKLAKKINNEERHTRRPERESFHNVTKQAAEKIVAKRNKKNIHFAKWYDNDLKKSEIIYPTS